MGDDPRAGHVDPALMTGFEALTEVRTLRGIVDRVNDGWDYVPPEGHGRKGLWFRLQDGANNWVVPAGADSIPTEAMTGAEQTAIYGEVVRTEEHTDG